MIEIEKNVPLPSKGGSRKNKHQSKFPFAQMDIGDSFFVPQTEANKNLVYYSVKYAKLRLGFRFTIRADNDNGGFRVWRVA